MTHDQSALATPSLSGSPRKPARYWVGFLLSLFLPGSGLAFIHRPALAAAFMLVSSALTSGPFARLIVGSFADTWGVFLGLGVIPLSLIMYRQVYVAQYIKNSGPPRSVALFWRLLGLWLPLLIIGLTELGYAQGWLPRAPGSRSLGQ